MKKNARSFTFQRPNSASIMLQLLALFTAIFVAGLNAHAQVNAYAEVSAVSGSALTIGSVNESFDTFESGDMVIVIQMQDDVIGSNTGDNVNFGDLSSIQNAGMFEISEIASVT